MAVDSLLPLVIQAGLRRHQTWTVTGCVILVGEWLVVAHVDVIVAQYTAGVDSAAVQRIAVVERVVVVVEVHTLLKNPSRHHGA